MFLDNFFFVLVVFWSAMGDISLEDVKNENVDLVRIKRKSKINSFCCLLCSGAYFFWLL